MVLREIARVPMSVFDEYRAFGFKKPRLHNFYMMYMGFIAVMVFGKGMEKIAARDAKDARNWETQRRLHRFFIPYSIASYKWRFPENKWAFMSHCLEEKRKSDWKEEQTWKREKKRENGHSKIKICKDYIIATMKQLYLTNLYFLSSLDAW